MMLLVERTLRPICIAAGSIFDLNLSTLLKVRGLEINELEFIYLSHALYSSDIENGIFIVRIIEKCVEDWLVAMFESHSQTLSKL